MQALKPNVTLIVQSIKRFAVGSVNMKSFKKFINEDGAVGAGAMGVSAIAGSGDTRLPSSQREPGVSKKHNSVLKGMFKRKPPKV